LRTLFKVTLILAISLISIEMGLVLNWIVLKAMLKAMSRPRPVAEG